MATLRITAAPYLFVIVAMVIFTPASLNARAAEPNIHVAVDPRVELMSIIFRLAGNPEYNQGRLESYLNDIDAHFAPHKNHAVITYAQQLRQKRGVSYDAVMSMAIHLTDTVELQPRVPFNAKDRLLDDRWKPDEARKFLDHARDFIMVADFARFLDTHKDLYHRTSAAMNDLLAQHAKLDWFEQFFGTRATARFIVIPAPVNGGQAYGPSVRLADGTEELFAILGVWQVDSNGDPQFDHSVLPTVIHEFCHSFVNHHVDEQEAALRKAGQTMYPLVEAAMAKQAYGNWNTMMKESLVRASVIRYLLANDPPAAPRQMQDDQRRSFHWMPKLVALFDEYEADRTKYPTLREFMPRVIGFFNEIASTLSQELKDSEAALEQRRPKVLSITPAYGAKEVDPATEFIIITFDRPMNTGGYSVMLGKGGRDTFPKVSFSSFDEAGQVFTMKVQLEPNRTYEFTLNNEAGGAFKAADGTPLKMTPVRFTTGPAK